MNSCILMAEIVQEPQLRYTSDNLALAEMLVEFPSWRDTDPPCHLKVIGWGRFAEEIQGRYHPGDRVVIEGRLSMNVVERPEGFKEKRAELVAKRIHSVGKESEVPSPPAKPSATKTNVVSLQSRRPQNASGSRKTDDANHPSTPASPPAQPRQPIPSKPSPLPTRQTSSSQEPPMEEYSEDDIPF